MMKGNDLASDLPACCLLCRLSQSQDSWVKTQGDLGTVEPGAGLEQAHHIDHHHRQGRHPYLEATGGRWQGEVGHLLGDGEDLDFLLALSLLSEGGEVGEEWVAANPEVEQQGEDQVEASH